jgi:hypothetical protein
MNFHKYLYISLLLISINQEFVLSSNYKKTLFNLINRENYSFKKTLLVRNDNNIKTIIVTGKGKSKEKAAMNAAQNALLMASPRYIKKRRVSLYKETMVNDNFMENESIDSFRDSSLGFNQGSILSFKLIKSYLKNNVHNVVAVAKVSFGLNDQEFHPLFQPPEANKEGDVNQKVFKIGTGFSEEEAMNDAIDQALIFIVGEKIDVETNLKVTEQLNVFIDNEIEDSELYTKATIGDLTSGYSEGYIESFKKLNSYKEDGFYKVEADIVVRVKTFSSYIDEKLNPKGININNAN